MQDSFHHSSSYTFNLLRTSSSLKLSFAWHFALLHEANQGSHLSSVRDEPHSRGSQLAVGGAE